MDLVIVIGWTQLGSWSLIMVGKAVALRSLLDTMHASKLPAMSALSSAHMITICNCIFKICTCLCWPCLAFYTAKLMNFVLSSSSVKAGQPWVSTSTQACYFASIALLPLAMQPCLPLCRTAWVLIAGYQYDLLEDVFSKPGCVIVINHWMVALHICVCMCNRVIMSVFGMTLKCHMAFQKRGITASSLFSL